MSRKKKSSHLAALAAGILIGIAIVVLVMAGLFLWGQEDNPGPLVVYPGESTADTQADTQADTPAETPETSQAVSPSQPSHSLAAEILSRMTLEEKVGQMFIARCPDENAAEKAAQYHLGGYILFATDFRDKTPAEARADIGACQEAADLPLFIGVDEEGGTVTRISRYPAYRSAPFASPQELYQEGGFDAIRKDTEDKCAFLRGLGINVNFAPVCDVSQNPEDFIYDRSFGQDAAQTSRYVSTVVEVMKEQQIGSVLKHFPGYGNNTDTHTGIACDNRSYETFLTCDLLPFEAGIEAGADMVLVSHNIVQCMDPDHPASLSPAVHELLRNELGFDGVIVTDDLAMEGVRDFADNADAEIAVMAVMAGNDLLCRTDFETQYPAVLTAVQNGEISVDQIDASVLRILEMKISLGILK